MPKPAATGRLWPIALCGLALAAGASVASAQADGEAIYRDACANCHGARGTGDRVTEIALETPVPDFTDCNFATREAAADWFAVVHEGGPVRGFAEVMPAFGGALSDEEIEAVVAYVLTLCDDDAWPRGELNLPRAFATEKAYPEDEAVVSTGFVAGEPGAVMSRLVWERRIGARNQLELVIPFGFRERDEPGGGWMRGRLGDVALGFKRAVFHSMRTGSIVSAAAELTLPTGDPDDGFGAGTVGFEPFVAVGQILPSDAFLQLQGGLELPLDTEHAEREHFLRAALGKTFVQPRFGRAWSPMVELLAAGVLERAAPIELDLLPQVQLSLNTRQHFALSGGVRLPLTDADVREPEIVVYLLWDWFDGGLLDGW